MPFNCIPDNYDLFERYDREMAKQEEKLPHCADCDQPIMDDHYFEINGESICPDCLDAYRREI